MKSNKRKITLLITSISLAVIMLIGLTVAYLTDMVSVTNIIGIGDDDSSGRKPIHLSLTEPEFVAQGASVVNHPNDPNQPVTVTMSGLVPGSKIYKDPKAKNIGYKDAYLRFKLLDSTGAPLSAAQVTLLNTALGLNMNTTSFVNNADGYWYYGSGTTPTVFTPNTEIDLFALDAARVSMTVPTSWKQADIDQFMTDFGGTNRRFTFQVQAEIIQTEGVNAAIPWADANGAIPQSEITAVRV